MKTVVYIPGDHSGLDMMEACMLVMEELNPPIRWVRAEAGLSAWERWGDTVPPQTWEALRESDACLFGAVTSVPGVKGFRSAIVQIRQAFDLYVNLRPFKTLPGVKSPLGKEIDLVLFRENTEDLYVGIERRGLEPKVLEAFPELSRFAGQEVAISLKVVTERGSRRIAEAALDYALRHGRRSVTVVEKPNVCRATGGMFVEVARSVLEGRIEYRVENVDATAMWLIKAPESYDVILTTNAFGDVLSDECAQLVGGLGVCGSANLGDSWALFEPAGGSVPKHAGKYLVNPTGMLISAAMMLHHLGMEGHAGRLERALASVLEEGIYLTYDLKPEGFVSTMRMAEAVAERL